MSITSFLIQISAILLANVAIMWWEKRQIKKEILSKIKLLEERKHGKYVFVVALEDFDFDVEILEEVLSSIGNPYKIYTNERDFLENMPSEPCVYVVDEKLEQSSGLDILKIIIKHNPYNFVILNTGIQNDTILAEYIKNDLDRFVYKNNIDHKKNLRAAIKDGIFAVVNK